MREVNGTNAVNETVIDAEVTCARESMEVGGAGRGAITYLVQKNKVY